LKNYLKKENKMKNSVIYARVSTEEQAEEGKSIETQIKLCKRWAKENESKVLEIFIDKGKSATTIRRPALQDMLVKCQEQNPRIDIVLVQDTDRLARNIYDHVFIKKTLKKKNVQLISISQPMIDDSPEGNLMDTMIASFNAFQSQITGRKTSKVLEEKAKMGWFPGGTPSLGYKNDENPSPTSTLDKRIIVVDYEIAPVIKEVFETYSTGNFNIIQIAQILNKKGIKSPRGSKIHPSFSNRLLKDDFYIGNFSWNGKHYKGKHEPILSEDLFYKVQQVINSHNQQACRKRVHNHLLKGYLFCGICKSRFYAEKHTKKNGTIYDLYYCSKCKKDSYVNTSILETQVEELFNSIEISSDYAKHVIETAKQILDESRNNQDVDRNRLNKEIIKLEKGMRETEDSRFITNSLSDENYIRISQRYSTQLKTLNSELSNLESQHNYSIDLIKRLVSLAENIGNAYKEASDELKRNYLSIFFKKIYVTNGIISGYELTEDTKTLIEEGSVLVSTKGLPR